MHNGTRKSWKVLNACCSEKAFDRGLLNTIITILIKLNIKPGFHFFKTTTVHFKISGLNLTVTVFYEYLRMLFLQFAAILLSSDADSITLKSPRTFI